MKWLLVTIFFIIAYFLVRIIEEIIDIHDFKVILNQYNEDFPEHKIEVPEKFEDLIELYEKVYINQVELSLLATATKRKENKKWNNK